MKYWRKVQFLLGGVGLLIVGVLFIICVRIYAMSPRPGCSGQIAIQWKLWLQETGGNAYPNVNGNAQKSLKLPDPDESGVFFWDERFHDYKYIPGLTSDDPDELVLFYKTNRTKFRSHGDRPFLWQLPFLEAKWIVVGPQFSGPDHGDYWIDTPEFKRRLRKTLDFLEENKRPNWEKVINEHKDFLESIEE